MRITRAPLALAAIALVVAAASAAAQAPPMPPMPKPGPEHKFLEQDAGTWDATVETFMAPGPPMVSKGVETNSMGCGGLCLISDFKGDMTGQAFHGHGVTVWDPAKKKYVGTWTDSMSTGMMLGESTYDAAKKTATGWMEGPDMTGKVTKSKAVVEYKDTATRVFSMYEAGPDGKDKLGMRITYKRRK
jgi:hypothetical protein